MILQVTNLTAERNERCLFNGLTFTLNPGEVLQIVGANGAGKTTLLRIVSGLLPALEGEIHWQNKSITHNRENYFSDLIYIGHLLGIKGGLTARENLQFAAQLAGKSKNSFEIDVALHAVGLQGVEDVETHTLSAGQQRRVNLARLALIPAALWILDEPFAALDASGITIIEHLILQHVAKQGMVLMTSHQPLDLEGVAHRQLALDI